MLQKFLTKLQRIAQVTLDPAKTLWVGVDVGSLRQVCCLGTHEKKLQRFSFTSTRSGLERLDQELSKLMLRHHFSEVVVAMEPTGMYWKPLAGQFRQRGIVVVLVKSTAVKANLKTYNEPSQTDELDAFAIWDLVRQGKAFLPIERDAQYEAAYRAMQFYDDARKRVGQLRNQLRSMLSLVFPELDRRFRSLEGVTALKFLHSNPTPESIRRLGKTRFLHRWRGRHGCWGRAFFEDLYEEAKTSIGVQEPAEQNRILVQQLTRQFEQAIKDCDSWFQQAKALLEDSKEYQRLLTVPGIAEKTAVGLLANLGSIERFSSGKQIVKLAGLAVVLKESGESVRRVPRISRQGKAMLRTWLYYIALTQIRIPGRCQDLYQRRRKSSPGRGSHTRALMAVSAKLALVIFAMLRDGKPYDASRDQHWEAFYAKAA